MAVLVLLIAAGAGMASGSGFRSRVEATDLLAGMIEQARATSIASRCDVVLAVAEPGDFPGRDQVCRLGLFKVASWPESPASPLSGVQVGHWRNLGTGVVLAGGRVDGLDNPLDDPEVTVSYGTHRTVVVKVHAIAFSARGGLRHPVGSSPVVMRIAEGNYRSGKATPFERGEDGTIPENRLKIGRVTARAYPIDE